MLSNTLENFREFGAKDGMLYSTSRLLEVFRLGSIYKYLIYAQPLPGQARLPERRGRNIETRWIDAGSPELADMPRPSEVIEQRYAQGARCLGAFIENQLVGCLWYLVGTYQEDEVRCDFDFNNQKQCIWDFDVYVAPEHRMGFVFMRLWDDVDKELHAQGYRWSLSRISAFNSHSVRSHERLGAKLIGSGTFLALGNLQLARSTFFAGTHCSTNEASRALMVISLPQALSVK